MKYVYILECSDGSFYVGSTRREDVATRISEHVLGIYPGYTASRRPVKLGWSAAFTSIAKHEPAGAPYLGVCRVRVSRLLGDPSI